MRVWMVIWSYWPAPQGGAERQCRLISPYLVDRGVDLSVVTARLSFSSKAQENDNSVLVHRIGFLIPLLLCIPTLFRTIVVFFFRGKNKLGQPLSDEFIFKIKFWSSLPFVWLARLLFMLAFAAHMYRKRKFLDLIHVHETGWLGSLAIALGSMLNIPVVCKEATYPPFPIIGWDVPGSWYLRRVQRKAFYIALNNQARDEIVRQQGNAAKVKVIPNAVQIPSRKAAPERSQTLLYVGNFSQGAFLKGFDVLFEAWAKAVRFIPHCRLVLAGAGDTSLWKTRVRELGCETSVKFLGFINEPEKLYQDAALLVLPSRVEGMSNALLEAFSWGLPVLASDIAGNRAIVREGENGILVPPGNVRGLSKAMVHLMQSPELRAKMGGASRLIAEKKFTTKAVSAQLVSLYEQIIRQSASA